MKQPTLCSPYCNSNAYRKWYRQKGPKIKSFPYATFEEDLQNLSFTSALGQLGTLPPLPWTPKLLTADEMAWEAAVMVKLPRARLLSMAKEYDRLLSSLPYPHRRLTIGTYLCKLPHKGPRSAPLKKYEMLTWASRHLIKVPLPEPERKW
jgi:hypothetical protein